MMDPYYFSASGRTATTLAEFLAACQFEAQAAVNHLREGYFEPWLRDLGRHDLADAAARIRLSGSVTRERLHEFLQFALESQPRSEARARAPKTMKAASSKKG
jgi:hypothetical protein